MSASEELHSPPPNCLEHRKVLFFDIDNTLYRKTFGIGDVMRDYIRRYIESTLHLSPEEAENLHESYYKDYGLALEGLVRNNHVDAMDYNAKVDDALPLEKCLKPDPNLIAMLSRVDRSKVKLWLCTNAYINHGLRVVRLLGIEEFFEGITYCDYKQEPLICKPMPQFFEKAMKDAGVGSNDSKSKSASSSSDCYFVDDSELNVEAAEKFGWHAVHINEPDEKDEPEDIVHAPLLKPTHEGGLPQIEYLLQLPVVFPHLFTKTPDTQNGKATQSSTPSIA